ncbi:hypothetical protein [Burkholderia sp. RS02]|uniref:hypothetical protein n=1 Tax=unclassified Burkholderia TaxID=2613784 RepID=UPI0032188430
MQLYSTTDTAASIRKAFAGFTHVLVNRGYTTIKPVFFKSASIADLPVCVWAWWDRASDGQLARWRDNGGVLLDRYTYSDRAGPADVLVFVECPMTMDRITRSYANTSEYTVIPTPHTWRVHEECIDLRTPRVDDLRAIWTACRGQRLTDEQLESKTGITCAMRIGCDLRFEQRLIAHILCLEQRSLSSLLALAQYPIRLDLPALRRIKMRIAQTRFFGFEIPIRSSRRRGACSIGQPAAALYFRFERGQAIRIRRRAPRGRCGLDEIEVEIVIRSISSASAGNRIATASAIIVSASAPRITARIRHTVIVDAGKQKAEKSLQKLAHGRPYALPAPTAWMLAVVALVMVITKSRKTVVAMVIVPASVHPVFVVTVNVCVVATLMTRSCQVKPAGLPCTTAGSAAIRLATVGNVIAPPAPKVPVKARKHCAAPLISVAESVFDAVAASAL